MTDSNEVQSLEEFFESLMKSSVNENDDRLEVSIEEFLSEFGIDGEFIELAGDGSDLPQTIISDHPDFENSGLMQMHFAPTGIYVYQGFKRYVRLSASESEHFSNRLAEAALTLHRLLEEPA